MKRGSARKLLTVSLVAQQNGLRVSASLRASHAGNHAAAILHGRSSGLRTPNAPRSRTCKDTIVALTLLCEQLLDLRMS